MRYTGQKLALFSTLQVLGVAAMIVLVGANQHPHCDPGSDCTPSTASIVLAIGLILGELAVVAAALRHDVPAWHSLVGLGAVFLVTAFVGGLCVVGMAAPHEVATVLAIWHVVIGVVLLASGAAAAFWDLLAKLRRSDDLQPGDRESSAMWPLD